MKKRIFSGIQPSGTLHIGNYLGAIKNWVKLQQDYESVFCVVDLHAITVTQDPKELRRNTIEVAKIYLASGIDPETSTIFVQSQVPEHAEMMWLLNTITKVSELNRMTQFKDKSRRGIKKWKNYKGEVIKRETISAEEYAKHKTSAGLFNYPILMAADILLYDTDLVPVGEDQLQHVELARTLARRFNARFGDLFKEPEAFVEKEGMRIMGLDNPKKKMSKSADSPYNYISLIDSEEIIRDKMKKAVTDSGKSIKYSDEKPAIKNLINIYALLDNAKPSDIEETYKGKGYADFKADLADIVISFLKPLQERMSSLDEEEVLKILSRGADKARLIARKKVAEAKTMMGLI